MAFRKGPGNALSTDPAQDLVPAPRSGTVQVKQAPKQLKNPQQGRQDTRSAQQQQQSGGSKHAASAHSMRSSHDSGKGAKPAHATNQQQSAQSSRKRQWPRLRAAPLLTNDIKTAADVQHLQLILSKHESALNGVHASLLLARCVEFASQDPVHWYHPDPQAFSGFQLRATVAASAWQGESGSTRSTSEDWGMSDSDGTDADAPAPGAQRRRVPQQLTHAQHREALQVLWQVVLQAANVAAWAAKQRGMDATAASCTISDLAQLGFAGKQVLASVLGACQSVLPDCSPSQLTSILWACAMLKWQPKPGLTEAADAALMKHLPRLKPMQLCTCVYALGRMAHRPSPAIMQAVCNRAIALLPSCSPSELANLVAGLAGMRHLPDDSWTAAYLQATMPRLRSYELTDLHRTLIALSALNCKPSEGWLNEFYSACRSVLVDEAPGNILTVRMMASMSFSLAHLGCRPDIRWMDVCLMRSRPSLDASPAADLTQLVCSLAMLRYRPGDTWLQAFLMAAFQRLDSFNPVQTVSMLQALARLGHLPPVMFLDELSSKMQPRLSCFSGEQLSEVVAAFARLRYRPKPEWLVAFESSSQGKLGDVSASGLTSVVWALAQMGHQPAVSWLYSFVLAAYGRLDAFDAGQLGVVFDALPRVSPTPTWLDELVQICASETSMRGRGLGSSSYEEEEQGHAEAAAAMDGSYSAAAGQGGSDAGSEASRSSGSGMQGSIWLSNEQTSSLRIYGLNGADTEIEAVPLTGPKGRVRSSSRAPSAVMSALGSATPKERVAVPMAAPAPRHPTQL